MGASFATRAGSPLKAGLGAWRPLVASSGVRGLRRHLLLLPSGGGRTCHGLGLVSPLCGGRACHGLRLVSPPCGVLSLQRRLHGGLLGPCLVWPSRGPCGLGRRRFLRSLLLWGRIGGSRWRCCHLLNLHLHAVLIRGRSSLTPRLVRRWRRRGGAGHLSKLAEPSPLRRRKVAGKERQRASRKSFRRAFESKI